jgi:glycosyltransferase involved in cell wall biosynthesis
MESVAVHAADLVIADAEAMKRVLLRRHPNMSPCEVISYGAPVVDEDPGTSVLARWTLTARSYYLLVARLVPENHVLEIVEGYLKSRSTTRLIVVGDRSANPYVKRLLENASDRVLFVGSVYDSTELRSLRYHARAYFHGHSVGGTNPSLLEALGCGNVVIAHDNVFNREVCGETGLYFTSPLDIPHLVERVDGYDKMTRIENSKRARAIISDRYTWDRVADRYCTLLNALES